MSPKGSMKTFSAPPSSAKADWPYHLTRTPSPRLGHRFAHHGNVTDRRLRGDAALAVGPAERRRGACDHAHGHAGQQRDADSSHERLGGGAHKEGGVAAGGGGRGGEAGEGRRR